MISVNASAQSYILSIQSADSFTNAYLTELKVRNKFEDIESLRLYSKTFIQDVRSQGYLSASIDSFTPFEDTVTVNFFLGRKYEWASLRWTETTENWLTEIGKSSTLFQNVPINPKELTKTTDKLLTYGENHGYPFAKVYIDSLMNIGETGFSGILAVEANRLFRYDTITVEGDAKISTAFLGQYLNIIPGELYQEKAVRNIKQKLQKLPFVQITDNPKVFFVDDEVRIIVSIKHRNTDQIDGIVGFAPNANSEAGLLVTGEVNIDLKNLFKRGIGYDVHWKSFAARSQQLQMNAQLPYLLKSPIGIDGNFDYVKFDTNFFTLNTRLGVRYLFEGTDYIKFYVQNHQSALIFADTNNIRVSRQIPNSNPTRTTSYGMKVQRQTLDNPFNPRKGISFSLDGNLGSRNVLKDIRIEQVLFRNMNNETYSVYDSTNLKSIQAEVLYNVELFLPVGKKSTVVGLISGQHLITETVFLNDLYRFGGTKSLRGFNEESLLSNSYTIVGLEYRYLLGGNAFFQLFANAAYLEDKSNMQQGLITDTPFGFGAGVHLDVNSGILSLAYALGSEQGNGIQFNQAKIHFGIINYL